MIFFHKKKKNLIEKKQPNEASFFVSLVLTPQGFSLLGGNDGFLAQPLPWRKTQPRCLVAFWGEPICVSWWHAGQDWTLE